jgi:hypothetical protein
MSRLPTVITSSVVRGTTQGESHGGLYLVDLDSGRTEQRLDWNRTDIDISGRGGDRGLRGIEFHEGRVVVAANSEILFLDQAFQCVETHTSPYLAHCHEISIHGSRLFAASTGFDSILMFDLAAKRFVAAYHFSADAQGLRLRPYDPQDPRGPPPSRNLHINSVKAAADGIYFSGVRMQALLRLNESGVTQVARVPAGTHNAQPLEGGIVYNDTASDRICYSGATGEFVRMSVPRFPAEEIINIGHFESTVARPGFARGLCSLGPGLIAGGSSPSTVCAYSLKDGERVALRNVSMDVRNAIHGLEVWPY